MTNRLPEIFTNNSTVFQSSIIRKKQGGIFQLHLKDKQYDQMNSTFTAGYKDKHYKTSLHKKVIRDTQSNYRTIPLKINQYQIPKQKRLLTSQFSMFRSAKIKSFSLEKNPQSCQIFHQSQQITNVNSIIAHKKHELVDIGFKMTPLAFVAQEYRRDLNRINNNIQGQLNEIEEQFSQSLQNIKNYMSNLRKQTGSQLKKNKIDLDKYENELKIYQQMAQDFPQKMDRLKNGI